MNINLNLALCMIQGFVGKLHTFKKRFLEFLSLVFLDFSIYRLAGRDGWLVGWQVAAQMTSHHFTAWRDCRWSAQQYHDHAVIIIIVVRIIWRQQCRVSFWCFGWVWQILGRLWWNTESLCGNFDGLSSIDAQEGILFGPFRIAKLAFNQIKIQMIFAESHCDNRCDKCYKVKYSHVIFSPNLYLCLCNLFRLNRICNLILMLGEWVTGEVHWSLVWQQIRSESHSNYQSIKLYDGCADLITSPTAPPIYTASWDLGYNTWGNSNAESWMAILNGNLIVEICNMCPQVRSQSRLGAFLEWLLWQRKPHTRINDVLTKIP